MISSTISGIMIKAPKSKHRCDIDILLLDFVVELVDVEVVNIYSQTAHGMQILLVALSILGLR